MVMNGLMTGMTPRMTIGTTLKSLQTWGRTLQVSRVPNWVPNWVPEWISTRIRVEFPIIPAAGFQNALNSQMRGFEISARNWYKPTWVLV